MVKSYITLKYEEFKAKFKTFFSQRNKIRALENYALCEEYEGVKYIRILKELLVDGFLDDEEAKFLDHQVKKLEIDYLSWVYRTPWLKSRLQARRSRNVSKKDNQLYFDFDRVREPANTIPVHLIKNSKNQTSARL